MSKRLAVSALVLGLAGAMTLTACSDDGGGDDVVLTVWSLEHQTDRVQAAQAAADRFTAQTGVRVEIVGTDENQFTQLITSAAAAGRMPDVVGALPIPPVWQLHANELLDTEAAAAVVRDLDAATFVDETLALTREGDTQLAVPSDTYAMLLIYRKDLFDAAGLPAPDTFERIQQAAQRLNRPDMAGITLSTSADDIFTAQTFEFFGLANNCEMVDSGGDVTLESGPCEGAFATYGDLARRYSIQGVQNVDSTRATYFSGKAAMMIWSSFILDELAGLRKDAQPSCNQCTGDPTWLAKNSGFVTAIKGPDGAEPAGYGELTSWVIPKGGDNSEAAQQYVKFMMNEGYLDWMGMAPEGKFPARPGTAENPQQFVTGWNNLPAGVDAKRPLAEVYPTEVIDTLRTSPSALKRWGITQGQGELIGATYGELALPKALNALASGQLDASAAMRQAADSVRSIKASIG